MKANFVLLCSALFGAISLVTTTTPEYCNKDLCTGLFVNHDCCKVVYDCCIKLLPVATGVIPPFVLEFPECALATIDFTVSPIDTIVVISTAPLCSQCPELKTTCSCVANNCLIRFIPIL